MSGEARRLAQALRWLQAAAVAAREAGSDDAALWQVLATQPYPPLPGWIAALAELPRARRVATAAGPAWRLRARLEGCSEPVPVQVLLLPAAAAVTLHASAWPAFAAVAARFALAVVCQAHGWRFPQDLNAPGRAAFVWALPWAGVPPLVLDAASRQRLHFDAAAGRLALAGTWEVNGRPGRVELAWSERTLAVTPLAGAGGLR